MDSLHSGDAPWGKFEARSGRFYPLIGHLLDTAAALEAMWDLNLQPNMCELLSDLYGTDLTLTQARQRATLLAALHDVGKCDPVFRYQLPKQPPWAPSVPDDAPKAPNRRGLEPIDAAEFRHEASTARFLRWDGAPHWATIGLEAHHGRFRRYREDPHRSLGYGFYSSQKHSTWAASATQVRLTIEQELGCTISSLKELDQDEQSAPALIAMAGTTSIADWLASDDENLDQGFEDLSQAHDWSEFLDRRREHFRSAIPDQLGRYQSPGSSFFANFGFEPTRPAQGLMANNTSPSDRFAIICAPTGSGKTEAALERHRRLGSSSIYFALPTVATADAMFRRVQNFFDRTGGTTGMLLHGRASFHDFYLGAPPARGSHIGNPSESATGLAANSWLRGRHRGLLAPVGVGTIDQALRGVLRSKYNTIALSAMANSHMVFDEAHSYDPYQQGLFCSLLRWLGYCKAPVTILSATLPTDVARRYLSAYLQGIDRDDARPLLGFKVPYPSVITADSEAEPIVTVLDAHDHRTVDLHHVSYDSLEGFAQQVSDTVSLVREDHADTAIGIIVNTIDTCLALAEKLIDTNTIILHSRMTAGQREHVESQVLNSVGPRCSSTGQLIIGTQVLEQSLDIDFDVLITQFCPAPDLVQRLGRLWRHSECDQAGHWQHPPKRQHRTGRPKAYVFSPSSLDKRSCLPYMEAVIQYSWQFGFLNGDLTELSVPGDLQALVDRSQVPYDAQSLSRPDVQEMLGEVAAKRETAASRSIPIEDLWWDDELGHLPDVTAGLTPDELTTRWDDVASETVVALGGGSRWALASLNDETTPKEIIMATIPISGKILRAAQPHLTEIGKLLSKPPSAVGDYRVLEIGLLDTLLLDDSLGLRQVAR